MNLNSFIKYNEESFFSFNDEMHLNNKIKNDNDVISFHHRARDLSAFINVIFINSAASVKNDSLTLISSSSFINSIF